MLIKTLLLNAFKLVGIPEIKGGVPKRSNGAGCKPVDWSSKVESFPPN